MRRYQSVEALNRDGSTARLSKADSHHLLRVNLTPRGTEVLLFDQMGFQARAKLDDVENDCAVFTLLENPRPVPELSPLLLIQGLAKKPATEHILRMATELGVTEIRLFCAKRSVAKGENRERWDRVANGALAQCGRNTAPKITYFQRLEDALSDLPSGERCYCTPGAQSPQTRPLATCLLVGPEGGLHPTEIQLAEATGFSGLGLGELVLRCDTAVAAALGLIRRS